MGNEKIVLIDGSSLLSTNFYATIDNGFYYAKSEKEKEKFYQKLLKTLDGKYINGVYGMTKLIDGMYEKVKPKHIVIAWDVSRKTTFRKELYPEYKGHRGKTPAPLKEQYQTAWDFFNELNIKQFRYHRYEADDIIGTLARQFNTNQIFIWSKDQDLLQLVNNTTRMWLITKKNEKMMQEMGIEKEMISGFNIPSGTFEHTPLTIEKFYGIKPKQIIDFKALDGDTSDNIDGIKGIGKKTIIPLLQEFETIENIYEFLDNSTIKEAKAMFKSLGIRSPLNKLMHKVDYDDLIFLLSSAIIDTNVEYERIEYNKAIGINTNAIDETELNNYLINLNKKDKKNIFKNIKKVSKNSNKNIYKIVSSIGKYIKDKSYKDVLLYKKLTTIKIDIPELEDITLKDVTHNYESLKKEVFEKYKFMSLL